MSELAHLEALLRRTARRRRWDTAWRSLWRALFFGACLWLTALIAYKLLPLPPEVLRWTGLAALVAAAAGFLRGWWRAPSLLETARWVEAREQLAERLSTAVELGREPRAGRWAALVLDDAARHAGGLDPRRLLPYHLPAAARWLFLLLAVGFGLGFVPEFRSKDYRARQRDAAVIKDTGRQLAQLVRRQIERRPPVAEPVADALQSAAELGDQLANARLDRAGALKDLANTTQRLEQQARELARDPVLRKLEQAARTPGGNTAAASAAMQQQREALQKALGDRAPTPDALEKLAEKLQQMKEAAASLGSKDAEGAKAAAEQLAKAMASASQSARQMGLSLPSLDAAIEALASQQAGLFLRDFNTALNDLEKMRDMAKAMQQLDQQAAQLGKDLAEQLAKGQAEAAGETMQKMIDQLRSAGLSSEQMQKLMEQVASAVKPATEYGKVSELLKQSGKSLGQGNKAAGAQSLAAAAEELKRLMDQMGDAAALAAALESLQRAQMCVGNGMGWGQGNRPSFGPGGKPGRGVGTWADESNWMYYPEISERWDNTGITRPDMDGRGHTDRGAGQLSDAATPTKVRGQFSPGNSMPSITLKGVSIKGQSTVAYTEAAQAAQSEAQSALNQDQVPRAYRGAVRDYFDDLK